MSEGVWRSIIGDTAELVHGYTMADVDRVTRHCVSAQPMPTLELEERWASAYHGVVETLYAWAYETPPTYKDLLDAGIRSMRDELRYERRQRGSNQRHPEDGTAPMFVRYWKPPAGDEDFTDKVVEPIALAQVLGELSPKLYEAVAAVAVHDNHADAAESLGISTAALKQRVHNARKILRRLWHAPETPYEPIVNENTCASGHDRAEYGRVTDAGNRWCLLCARRNSRRQRVRAS